MVRHVHHIIICPCGHRRS